jgi:hypothetical protein
MHDFLAAPQPHRDIDEITGIFVPPAAQPPRRRRQQVKVNRFDANTAAHQRFDAGEQRRHFLGQCGSGELVGNAFWNLGDRGGG